MANDKDHDEDEAAWISAMLLAGIRLGYVERSEEGGSPAIRELGFPDDHEKWDALAHELYDQHSNEELAKLIRGDN